MNVLFTVIFLLCIFSQAQSLNFLSLFCENDYSNVKENDDKIMHSLALFSNLIIDETVKLEDKSEYILGDGNIRIDSIERKGQKEMFYLKNSTFTIENVILNKHKFCYIAKVNKESYLNVENIVFEGDFSFQNAFDVCGGKVRLFNSSFPEGVIVTSFIRLNDEESNLVVDYMNLKSNIVTGSSSLFFSTRSLIQNSLFSNITSHVSFHYNVKLKQKEEFQIARSNNFKNCENVLDGLILSKQPLLSFSSFNNSFICSFTSYNDHQNVDGNKIFENDIFDSCMSNESGGAISFVGTSLKLISCNFTFCKSNSTGGAIYCSTFNVTNGSFHIDKSIFNSCVANKGGGAIDLYNGKIICNNTKYNNCSCGNTKRGGALYLAGMFNADQSQFINCYYYLCNSDEGGAIFVNEPKGIFTFSNCTFSSCYGVCGGSVYILDLEFSLIFKSCAFCSSFAENEGDDVYTNIWNGLFNESSFSNCFTTGQRHSVYYSVNSEEFNFMTYSADPTVHVGCNLEGTSGPGTPHGNHSKSDFIQYLIYFGGFIGFIIVISIIIGICCCCGVCSKKSRKKKKSMYIKGKKGEVVKPGASTYDPDSAKNYVSNSTSSTVTNNTNSANNSRKSNSTVNSNENLSSSSSSSSSSSTSTSSAAILAAPSKSDINNSTQPIPSQSQQSIQIQQQPPPPPQQSPQQQQMIIANPYIPSQHPNSQLYIQMQPMPQMQGMVNNQQMTISQPPSNGYMPPASNMDDSQEKGTEAIPCSNLIEKGEASIPDSNTIPNTNINQQNTQPIQSQQQIPVQQGIIMVQAPMQQQPGQPTGMYQFYGQQQISLSNSQHQMYIATQQQQMMQVNQGGNVVIIPNQQNIQPVNQQVYVTPPSTYTPNNIVYTTQQPVAPVPVSNIPPPSNINQPPSVLPQQENHNETMPFATNLDDNDLKS